VTGAVSVSSTAAVSRTSSLGERDRGLLYPRRYKPTVEDPAAYGSTAELTYRDGLALQHTPGSADELGGLASSYVEREEHGKLGLCAVQCLHEVRLRELRLREL
jgi:hypothetical protein